MNGLSGRRTLRLALGLALVVAGLGSALAAQAAEYYEVGVPITLDQALKKPDSTKVMGPDCKLTTVGELRKLHAAKSNPTGKPKAITGGTGKTSYGPGSAKARESAGLLNSVSGEAQGSRSVLGARIIGAVNKTPGIAAVNGKATGFVLTPGAYLTVGGVDLGDTMGQLNIVGNFPGGALAPRIVDWKNNSVYALLPDGIKGVLDQPVTVQVVTAARKTHRHEGGRFHATREDVTVTTNIPRFLKFQSGPSWGATMDANGQVFRFDTGESINCKAAGADTLTIIDPGKGFVVTGLSADWSGRTDSGDGDANGFDGSRTYSPGYGFGEWSGNSIQVKWGVWRSHESSNGALKSSDECDSIYKISVTLSGPAGVTP